MKLPSSSFLAAATLGLLTLSPFNGGQAVTFGGLNVTPRGPQNLNLETGVTELPGGGTATDSKGGLKLVASAMTLNPGKTLTAQNAVLTTKQGGTLRAAQVTYDLKSSTVTATGNVTYNDARFKNLSAPRVTLNVGTAFVSASGGVRAEGPALSGAALAFDLNTMQAVLTGPYTARQGTLNASADAEGRLLLVFGGHQVVRSSASPDAATLGRFAPYLK
ncbi:hypothetical protein GCM10010840_22340 [Deinococcus aerolatus]|uniref:Lipopolysaccharide export system protein LptA n=1 Tax=Deinococcus aerolatus TaxID=522487 RepID=A0ABQ2GAS8_9DEIO|nr:hypothetical protein [Deinococcus aerolatus]GGL84067.1 hypothetical protein GCM10010840_22340 [Deinococcus aerolatus]